MHCFRNAVYAGVSPLQPIKTACLAACVDSGAPAASRQMSLRAPGDAAPARPACRHRPERAARQQRLHRRHVPAARQPQERLRQRRRAREHSRGLRLR